MNIELPEHIHRWLEREARRRSVTAEEVLLEIVLSDFTWLSNGPETEKSITELFAEWAAEDHTNDPEEIARRNQEHEELKLALNRNRLEMEGPNARMPECPSHNPTLSIHDYNVYRYTVDE